MFEPGIGVAQRPGVKRATMHPPIDGALDELRVFQHTQMFRHRRKRHIEWPREFADRRRPARELREQGAPCAVRERVKHAVEPLRRGPRGARA
jgi:hypothetical protein